MTDTPLVSEIGRLLDRSEIEDAIAAGELAAWKERRYTQFTETMRDTSYPCHFAVEAERTGTARFLFVGNPRDRDTLIDVKEGIQQYLEEYQSIAGRTTLVIFFDVPDDAWTERTYRDQFWRTLEYLNEHDPEPWPSDVPVDPAHPDWEFCFGGESMFVVGRAPFYTARKSRHTPNGLEITIQPRRVLDEVSGDTEEGQRARSVIRDRLAEYDDVAPHPDIGDYGDPDAREWEQYLLPTTNEESLEEFPFTIDPDGA